MRRARFLQSLPSSFHKSATRRKSARDPFRDEPELRAPVSGQGGVHFTERSFACHFHITESLFNQSRADCNF